MAEVLGHLAISERILDGMTEWGRISGIDDVEWSNAREGHDGPVWSRLDTPPRAGDRLTLVRAQPLPPSTFWALFCPALSSINGWEDHPSELAASCVVRCAIEVDLGRREWGRDGARWQAAVSVLDTIALDALATRFAPDPAGVVPELPGRRSRLDFGAFTVFRGNLESDVTGYLVCLETGGGHALVLHGESYFAESRFVAGHHPIPASIFAALMRTAAN